jgi:hypothetical protein
LVPRLHLIGHQFLLAPETTGQNRNSGFFTPSFREPRVLGFPRTGNLPADERTGVMEAIRVLIEQAVKELRASE